MAVCVERRHATPERVSRIRLCREGKDTVDTVRIRYGTVVLDTVYGTVRKPYNRVPSVSRVRTVSTAVP